MTESIKKLAETMAHDSIERLRKFGEREANIDQLDAVREEVLLFVRERFPDAPAERVAAAVEVAVRRSEERLEIDFDLIARVISDG